MKTETDEDINRSEPERDGVACEDVFVEHGLREIRNRREQRQQLARVEL
jgi:hypothetical protein